MAKCKVCGRTFCSAGLCLEPREDIPEIKKTMCFCSRRCANTFLGRIKAQYKKRAKQSVRKELEKADRVPDNEDLSMIYHTLTENEKLIMFVVAAQGEMFSGIPIKDFYRRLNEFSSKRGV